MFDFEGFFEFLHLFFPVFVFFTVSVPGPLIESLVFFGECHGLVNFINWLSSGVQHDSELQQHDCVRWCHHLCLVPDLILPSLHLHGGVYFNTFLGMLVMSVFALGCDVRASTSRSSGVIR